MRRILVIIFFALPTILQAESNNIVRAHHPVPGSYIVTLHSDAPELGVAARHLKSEAGGTLRHTYGALIKAFWIEMTEEQAHRLAQHPWVARVEEDAIIEIAATQTNLGPVVVSNPGHRHLTTESSLWYLDRIDQATPTDPRFNDKYHYCSTGSGVRIYVVDTGVLPIHKEFQTAGVSRVDPATNFQTGAGALNLGQQCWVAGDQYSHTAGAMHGTAVASIAAGNTFGVAKKATVVDVRVFPCGGRTATSNVLVGLDWIPTDPNRQAGTPRVVNLSFEAVSGGPAATSLRDSIAQLTDVHGMTVVAAAGNQNDTTYWYVPANSARTITVAGTAKNSDGGADTKWSRSNWGYQVDFYAPAQYIESASTVTTELYPNLFTRDELRSEASDCLNYQHDTCTSGTSFAAPIMSGVVARYLENNKNATRDQVVSFLQSESATSTGVQVQDPGGQYPLVNLSDYAGEGICQ